MRILVWFSALEKRGRKEEVLLLKMLRFWDFVTLSKPLPGLLWSCVWLGSWKADKSKLECLIWSVGGCCWVGNCWMMPVTQVGWGVSGPFALSLIAALGAEVALLSYTRKAYIRVGRLRRWNNKGMRGRVSTAAETKSSANGQKPHFVW